MAEAVMKEGSRRGSHTLQQRLSEIDAEQSRIRDGIDYLRQLSQALAGVNVFQELPISVQKQVLRHLVQRIDARRAGPKSDEVEAVITWVEWPQLTAQGASLPTSLAAL